MNQKLSFLAVVAIAAAAFSFSGCSSVTTNPAVKAAANTALVDGTEILGQAATQTLWNVAKSEADNGSANWQSAATQGLFANLNTATGAKVVSDIINSYSAAKAPNTAAAAQAAFASATNSTNTSAIVTAIANTINSAVSASTTAAASNP